MTDPLGVHAYSLFMERNHGFSAAMPMIGIFRRPVYRVPATVLSYVEKASKNSPPLAESVEGHLRGYERRFGLFSPSFVPSEFRSISHACVSMADMCFCDLVLKAVSSSFESGDRARVSTELLTLFFSSSLLCCEKCMEGAAMIRRRRETWTE